jgi:hypothetical protein
MFELGERVMTRKGTQGTIVRRPAEGPPYRYFVEAFDGEPLFVDDHDLRRAADVERWLQRDTPWDGVERRRDERRRVERRGSPRRNMPSVRVTRGVDRRQQERRWLTLSEPG